MDEHRAALDVGEELVPEAGAGGGALDQPGNVGEDGLAILAVDHPERRRDRRERVVGDLRRRPGQPPEQRGLAGVGQADQAGVGEQLEAELDPVLLAAGPALGEAGSLPGRVREALVAVSAAPAVGDDGALPGADQVDAAAVDRDSLGPRRDQDLVVLPPAPVAVRAFAVTPLPSPEVLAALQGRQVAPRWVADEDDVAAVAAVAAVGSAARDVRLTPERDAAVTAGSALDPDLRAVVHHAPAAIPG